MDDDFDVPEGTTQFSVNQYLSPFIVPADLEVEKFADVQVVRAPDSMKVEKNADWTSIPRGRE